VALAVLPVLLLVVVNTPPGRQALAWLTPKLTGDTVRLAGIAGRFPDALRVALVELRDPQGAYATVEDLALDWSPLQLLNRRIVIDRLEAARIEAIRMPTGSSSGSAGLPMPVILRELRVARLDVGPALAGTAAAVALDGSGELTAPTDFSGSLNVRQIDGAGSYAMTATADAARLQATLHVSEPSRGLLASLAGLPDLGAVAIDASLDGPRDAIVTRTTLTAGPMQATVGGTLDLQHEAADLMVFKAAALYDRGEPCGAESNAAKYLAAEACFRACEQSMLAHGGMGYAKEYHIERFLREAMIPRLAPVSPQLILCFIAEKVLGLPKSY
jgi:autotransporter translocation and assembly factor TamB